MSKYSDYVDDTKSEIRWYKSTVDELNKSIDRLTEILEDKEKGLLTCSKKRIEEAIKLIYDYSQFDGSHHKDWVFDQVIRVLVDDYEQWVKDYNSGEDGENTYEWSEGIAP